MTTFDQKREGEYVQWLRMTIGIPLFLAERESKSI